MEKLELKHLAPYLPYGLKVCLNNTTYKRSLIGINLESEMVHLTSNEDNETHHFYFNIKPILRPLSDLTEVKDSNVLFAFGAINDHFFNRVEKGFISYGQMTFLLESHYDIFGLIEKGLAIDINTLDK